MPLIQINQNLLNSYKRELAHQNIPVKEQWHYVKWLRYYLDFCQLVAGNWQSKQANQKSGNKGGSRGAVGETPDSYPVKKAVRSLKPERRPTDDSIKSDSANDLETGQSWQDEFQKLADEINVRHYAPKTLKSYRLWVQKFQTYTRSKSPSLFNVGDTSSSDETGSPILGAGSNRHQYCFASSFVMVR